MKKICELKELLKLDFILDVCNKKIKETKSTQWLEEKIKVLEIKTRCLNNISDGYIIGNDIDKSEMLNYLAMYNVWKEVYKNHEC